MTSSAPLLWGGAGLAAVVGVWQLAVTFDLVARSSLPGPAATARSVGRLLGNDRFRAELGVTMQAWAWALLLAIVVAVPLGLVIGRFDFWYRSAGMIVDIARSVPPAALIPAAISIFGLGFQTKLFVVSFAIVWLILVNTVYGVRGVDPTALQVARSLRWTKLQTFWRVILPSASPSIATGIKLAAAIAFVVVLSAELLGAGDGVGAQMLRFGEANDTEAVYAAIVVIGAIGVTLAAVLTAIEKRLLRWHGAFRDG
ncbi:ABC transporter permease [Desertimonas flava]|uniref:ABC transporter permease n=1 Tax=Desertimonas flava TaxID=2064846 RepID=UPI0013C534B8|nr:ABC transporter permease [Desertimonas flava]